MRYFIIFYDWSYNNESGKGNIGFGNDLFPNRKEILLYIVEGIKKSFSFSFNIPTSEIVITNILELSKDDYEQWFKE